MRLRLARSAEAHPPLLDERDAPYAVPGAAQQEGTAARRASWRAWWGSLRWANVPCLGGQKGGECGPWSRNTKGELALINRSPGDMQSSTPRNRDVRPQHTSS